MLRSFERWMSEEEGDACATGAGTTNYTRRPSPARPSPAAGHSSPFRFLCVCRSHSLRGRANKSNKRVGGAVTDTTYDVNLPAPPLPFQPSLYRSTSPRPPRDSICQLVSGDSFNPWPDVSSCWPTPSRPSVSSPHVFSRDSACPFEVSVSGVRGRNRERWNLEFTPCVVTCNACSLTALFWWLNWWWGII